jgi:quercetin dioxygenase-like cupin family protein
MNFVDGVFVKQLLFKNVGDTMQGHQHQHNHITLLAAGKLEVTVNDKVTEFTAPQMIFIHKDHKHQLVALQENTVAYCIHAVRDKETGEILEGLGAPDPSIMQPVAITN